LNITRKSAVFAREYDTIQTQKTSKSATVIQKSNGNNLFSSVFSFDTVQQSIKYTSKFV